MSGPAHAIQIVARDSSIMDPRVAASQVLKKVLLNREYLDVALTGQLDNISDPRDKKLVQELCYGVMRWYFRLDFILQSLLSKPLKDKETEVRALLLCGLYQLISLRVPDHAAVAASVEAARKLGKTWAVPLINAVLRRYLRERQGMEDLIQANQEASYASPRWLIDKLSQQWPLDWQAILQGMNDYPPLHLRVNLLRTSRQDYLDTLHEAGIAAKAATINSSGIRILKPLPVEAIPGFAAGLVSIQDLAAQLAAPLLDARPGERVLDGCAAPGGKTAHIHEITPTLAELIALEADETRLRQVEQARQRLGFNAKLIHSDIIDTGKWWDGKPFDRILLDVPCSATGVIRRHPDIRVLRKPGHIKKLMRTQRQILDAAWPLLKPGGTLVYVTCSLLLEEGDEQINRFRQTHPEARPLVIDAQWGVATAHGRQILPGREGTDGFYFARLVKP